MKSLSKLLMNLAVKIAFGKIDPLPWHIEPIVKEIVLAGFTIGIFFCFFCVLIINLLT